MSKEILWERAAPVSEGRNRGDHVLGWCWFLGERKGLEWGLVLREGEPGQRVLGRRLVSLPLLALVLIRRADGVRIVFGSAHVLPHLLRWAQHLHAYHSLIVENDPLKSPK